MNRYILFFAFFIPFTSFGQFGLKQFRIKHKQKVQNRWEIEKVYRTRSVGFTYQSQQQQVFSQNQYSGFGVNLYFDKLVDRPKSQSGIETYGSFNPFLSSTNSGSNTMSADAIFGIYHLRKLNPAFSVGGQFNSMIGARLNSNYDNNSVQTEVALELAPKIRFEKDFRLLKKNYGINYTLSATIVGFGAWTPTYTSNFTLLGFGVLSPLNYNHFNSKVFLKLPAKKRFATIHPTIGYGWNAYFLKVNNEQRSINALHSIFLIANIQKLK